MSKHEIDLERLKDLAGDAEVLAWKPSNVSRYMAAVRPDVVLALIERLERAEARVGAAVEWIKDSGCTCRLDCCSQEPGCPGELEAKLREFGAL